MTFNKKWAVAAILASMFSIQGGASVAKYLFPLIGPAGAITLRIGLAGLILALFNRPRIFSFGRKEWLCILFYGISVGGMGLTFYYGIQRIPLGIGVTIEFIGPLGLALAASRRLVDFIWVVLAAAGVLLIVPWQSGTSDWIGILFVAVAGLLWAGYILSASWITGKIRNSDAVSCGMCVAALLILPFGIFSGDLLLLNWKMLLLGFGVAMFSSIFPFSLDLIAIRKLPAKTFSVLQSLQPAFAALSGLIFLGEILSGLQWLAIFCIVVASAGATLSAPEKKQS